MANQQDNRVIVIGAGPAGLMAAISAASLGSSVLVLEKMPSPGRKLLLTGAGRCNLTNTADIREFLEHYFGQGRFLYPAFSQFFRPELLALLAEEGVPAVAEASGKIFPASDRAADVLNALLRRARSGKVQFMVSQPVQKILTEHGRVTGVLTARDEYAARAVILAAGGKSWPAAGSSGDGFRLAAEIGHHLVTVRPALVPLVVEQEWVRGLSGLSCPAVRAMLLKDGKPVGQASGELLWTHFGLSGPVILRLSRDMTSQAGAEDGSEAGWQVQLDLRPDLKSGDLLATLAASIAGKPRHLLKNVLGGTGILPGALLLSLMQVCQIPADLPASQTSKQQLHRLAGIIKQLMLPVAGTRGFRESMVTAGGVDLREIDPRTMASRLAKGLFLAGEVIDLDGDTGGYNLQAAFSTGFLAGRSAAEYCSKPDEVQSEV